MTAPRKQPRDDSSSEMFPRARAKSLVIDGSNTVHAIFGSWPDSHQEQNRCAADFLAGLCRWSGTHANFEIEVVFDGSFRSLQADRSEGNVRVLFSDHESADPIIIERARALRFFGKHVTVVTQDRALAEMARAEEAKIISPERLWDWIR